MSTRTSLRDFRVSGAQERSRYGATTQMMSTSDPRRFQERGDRGSNNDGYTTAHLGTRRQADVAMQSITRLGTLQEQYPTEVSTMIPSRGERLPKDMFKPGMIIRATLHVSVPTSSSFFGTIHGWGVQYTSFKSWLMTHVFRKMKFTQFANSKSPTGSRFPREF